DAAWESAPYLCRCEKSECDELGRDNCRDDTGRVARARVAPHSAVQAERNEGRVTSEQHDRQGDEEDVSLVRRAAALQTDVVRGEKGRGDQREVDERFDQAARVGDERS